PAPVPRLLRGAASISARCTAHTTDVSRGAPGRTGIVMPSTSLQEWLNVRVVHLDEIEAAHRSVGGTGPGRRYATQQINQAYAVLLSSHFQGFCRDLHTECVDHLIRAVPSAAIQPILGHGLVWARKLDSGNPNPDNIGTDFSRLGIRFWAQVEASDGRNSFRKVQLAELNRWR